MKRFFIKTILLLLLWTVGIIVETRFSLRRVDFFVGYWSCFIFSYEYIMRRDKVKKGKLRIIEGGRLGFYCKGCGYYHYINIDGINNPIWSFNDDYEKPTFSPSILVQGIRLTERGKRDYEEWYSKGCPEGVGPFDAVPTICHSFVNDGKIQYLDDCTHRLAGQIIELEDEEE